MSNAAQFLAHFNKIEAYLCNCLQASDRQSFGSMVSQVAGRSALVRSHQQTLRKYADLRNAIVHLSTDQPIAEPSASVTREIERIAQLLLDPPKVLPEFGHIVYSFRLLDPIATAVEAMTRNSYSQVPVLDDNNQVKYLLTNNTISRWLGRNVADGIFSLHETTVGEVLQFAEYADNFKVVPRNMDVYQVREKFHEYQQKGRILDAVLITEHGRTTEKLLGIIAIHDILKLNSLLL